MVRASEITDSNKPITRTTYNPLVQDYVSQTETGYTQTIPSPKTASYIIMKIGSDYYAINGLTNVCDYGGSGDAGGVDGTDARAVIQACIDAVYTAGGGLIYIKKATYSVRKNPTTFSLKGWNVAIHPRSNVHIRCEKGTTVICNNTTYDYADLISLIYFKAAEGGMDSELTNFTIDGGIWDAHHGDKKNTVGVGGGGGYYANCHGLYFVGGSSNLVENVVIKNGTIQNVAAKNGFTQTKGCMFHKMFMSYAGANAWVCEKASAASPSWDMEWTILSNSEFENCGNVAIAVWYASNVLITHNRSHDGAVGGDKYLFFADNNSENVIVAHNHFYGTGKVSTHPSTNGGIIFIGNSFANGVWLQGKGIHLKNNVITSTVTVWGAAGSPADSYSSIEGNHFIGARIDVKTNDASRMHHINITNNAFDGTGECIRLHAKATEILIKNNIMKGSVGIAGYDDDVFTSIDILNNDLTECTTKVDVDLYDYGTSIKVLNNRGYNPFGVDANPFDTTNDLLRPSGDAAVPAASTDYVVEGIDLVLSSTDSGNTDCAIQIKDADGNNINPSTLSTLSFIYLPIGYKVNWGAFTGAAPTVVATFV